jgi:hypothetical protein
MSNMLNEYVKRPTNVKSELAEVMDRRQNEKIQELNNVKLDAMIAEEKKKLADATPIKVDSSQSTNSMTFLSSLFVGKSPAEIKEIIRSFSQEEIDRLTYMARSANQNSFVDPRGFAPRDSNSEMKNMLEALKIGLEAGRKNEGNGVDLKGLAEIFKAGVEASKVQQPANPQPDLQYKIVESTLAELRAAREETSRQDRLRTEREIADLKNRPSGFDELVYNEEKAAKVRKIFGGADTGAANEFTLRKAEMDQTERLETRKLDWEEKKWEKEKDKEGNTLETVKAILEGPAGEILKSFGNAGAERIRGGAKTPTSNGQAHPSQIAQIKCPSCGGLFQVNTQLPMIQCPLCGVQLQNGNQPAPQQEQPSQAPIQQPVPNPAQVEPSQTPAPIQEKPVDQTVEAEPIAEQPTQ